MAFEEEFYARAASLTAQKSFCIRRKVGAVLVKEGHIVLSACNGAGSVCQICVRNQNKIKPGLLHSTCNGMHAERRLLQLAAGRSIDVRGAAVYCTHSPCSECALALAEAKIAQFIYLEEYPDPAFKPLFEENRILYRKMGMDEK